MSIVDKLIAQHEEETKALVDNPCCSADIRDHAVRQISEMIALARELEVHCEAMALFADDHWPGCKCAGCSYLAWKKKRMNGE